MKRILLWILVATAGSCAVLLFSRRAETQAAPQGSTSMFEQQVEQNRAQMFDQGKHIFRYDTFGDEAFWGGTLRLHQAIAGEKNAGVGPA